MMKQSRYQIKLKALKEVLRLTKEGKLEWSCTEIDTRYQSIYKEHVFEVEFIRLLRVDEVGSDKMIASIQLIDLAEDFAVGTEGFDLIIEIIAISQPNWKPSWERGIRRSEDNLNILKNL